MKTHWKKAFKSDYLSSADIDDKEVKLTIAKVVYQECMTQSGKKFCNVAHFKEANVKPMILNVVNSKTIKKFSGNKQHLEDWIDIPVIVYVNPQIKFGADIVEGLRIKEYQPSLSKPKLIETMPAWQKAIDKLKQGGKIEDIEKVYDLTGVKEKLINLAL